MRGICPVHQNQVFMTIWLSYLPKSSLSLRHHQATRTKILSPTRVHHSINKQLLKTLMIHTASHQPLRLTANLRILGLSARLLYIGVAIVEWRFVGCTSSSKLHTSLKLPIYQPYLFSAHVNRKHKRRFSCTVDGCTMVFNLRADLIRHTPTHCNPSSRSQFACSVSGCQKTFTRKDNLGRHEAKAHSWPTTNYAGLAIQRSWGFLPSLKFSLSCDGAFHGVTKKPCSV
jgi:uncharacterized C2H2 Zn-finger protein